MRIKTKPLTVENYLMYNLNMYFKLQLYHQESESHVAFSIESERSEKQNW